MHSQLSQRACWRVSAESRMYATPSILEANHNYMARIEKRHRNGADRDGQFGKRGGDLAL